MHQVLYKGTIIELFETDSKEVENYLLAECFEDDYIFQIIRFDGYQRGSIAGYIKKENSMSEMTIAGISQEHLIKELRRNLIDFDLKEMKILRHPDERM